MSNINRIIMHIDMNAFFASVEQRCNPKLRGKPIAVIGSAERTVVTTASYEARKYGVKTGMNKYEAKKLCSGIIFVTGDNQKYIDTSVRILGILKDFTPVVEAYSIDEAFLDITGSLSLFKSPEDIAIVIKDRIRKEIGLTCSIGIAPNKLLAKLASDMKKPDGLVIIKGEDIPRILENLPVEELCGIGPKLKEHLNDMGIKTCGQLGKYPLRLLKRKFGVIGEGLKLMSQGIDNSPVIPIGMEEEAKSVGHSMTLPYDISDEITMKKYILQLSEMVGRRARRYRLKGRNISLTIRYPDFYTFTRQKTLKVYTNDTHDIYHHALLILNSIKLKGGIRLLGVRLSDLMKDYSQLPLYEEDRKKEITLIAMDGINDKFGDFTITWGRLLERDRESGVISPSWRPEGVKRVECK
ncbi:MAG: DNA polymerase IV [Nitrospinota bacterium]